MKRLLVITEIEGDFISFGYIRVPDDVEVKMFDVGYYPETSAAGRGIRKLASLSDEEIAAGEKQMAEALAAQTS